MNERKEETGKSRDEKLLEMIDAVIDGTFEVAKTAARAGVRGVFAVKGLGDRVEAGGDLEQMIGATFRRAKAKVKELLDDLVPDEAKGKTNSRK